VSDRFTVTVTTGGEMPVVELGGQIDRDAEVELLAAFDQASEGASSVALDFARTDYINSTGLAVLVQVLAKARAAGREIHVHNLSPHYREIFLITRLSDFVTLHPERTAA
jgi:anti-anti-sigma factor